MNAAKASTQQEKMKIVQNNSRLGENSTKKIVRYNLALPEPLMNELRSIAKADCTTALEVIRKFIKVGLVIESVQKNGGKVIIEEKGKKILLTHI